MPVTSPSSSATSRHRSKPIRRAVDRWAGTQWGGLGTALAAILAGAAAIRLVGIQYGLPFGNLLNPDEQSIVPRAWKLVHGGGGDPHWFDYPSLLMYVNAPFQAWHSEPSYLTARIVGVVIATAAVAAAWWLGRRAYGPAAGLVAGATVAVCTIHVAYSRAAVTDVPLTLGVAVALALMVKGRLELAGLAVGAAMGFKYPGVFLLFPLVVAGWRQWSRLAVSASLALSRRSRTDLVLASFVLVYALDLLTIRAHFDRYVLPLVPPLGALAGRFRSLAPVALLLLVVPLTWAVRDAKVLTRTDTRVIASRWVEEHVPRGTHVAADPSTPSFRFLRVLPLQLPGPSRAFDPNRSIARLRGLGIHVVVVTGAVTDRVLAARSEYPREARFYEDLRAQARRLYYVEPGGDRAGPWVAVYRI